MVVVVVAVDEVAAAAAAEVHDMEVGDMITMVTVMEEIGGETMVYIPSPCVDSIDCCCSGPYHL